MQFTNFFLNFSFTVSSKNRCNLDFENNFRNCWIQYFSSFISSSSDLEMESTMSSSGFDDFLQSGRTGRRNATPDITLASSATVSTSGLPLALEKLSCTGMLFACRCE